MLCEPLYAWSRWNQCRERRMKAQYKNSQCLMPSLQLSVSESACLFVCLSAWEPIMRRRLITVDIDWSSDLSDTMSMEFRPTLCFFVAIAAAGKYCRYVSYMMIAMWSGRLTKTTTLHHHGIIYLIANILHCCALQLRKFHYRRNIGVRYRYRNERWR